MLTQPLRIMNNIVNKRHFCQVTMYVFSKFLLTIFLIGKVLASSSWDCCDQNVDIDAVQFSSCQGVSITTQLVGSMILSLS